MKLSEKYIERANEMMRNAEKSDSMTNWTEVRRLQSIAQEYAEKEKEIEMADRKADLDVLRKLVENINNKHGTGLTVAYIGNVDQNGGDDREFFIGAPHPGRVGRTTDRFGSHSASELKELIRLCEGRILEWALAHKQANHY